MRVDARTQTRAWATDSQRRAGAMRGLSATTVHGTPPRQSYDCRDRDTAVPPGWLSHPQSHPVPPRPPASRSARGPPTVPMPRIRLGREEGSAPPPPKKGAPTGRCQADQQQPPCWGRASPPRGRASRQADGGQAARSHCTQFTGGPMRSDPRGARGGAGQSVACGPDLRHTAGPLAGPRGAFASFRPLVLCSAAPVH